MKRKPATATLIPTTVRLDVDLIERAHALARKNKRAHPRIAEDTFYKVVNAALADYLNGKRGA